MLKLFKIETQGQLEHIMQNPAKMEDQTLYETENPDYAGMLAMQKLPCIFIEKSQDTSSVYGVDLIIRENDTDIAYDWRYDQDMLENIWKRHYGIPWMIAETERLLIRESVMEDLSAFLVMYAEEQNNPDVKPFSEEPERELQAYIQNRYPFFGYGLWSIVEKENGCVIGRIGFEEVDQYIELSYLILKSERKRGYAKEAVQAVLSYAKEYLFFQQIIIRTSRENTASERLAIRIGFHREEISEKNFRNRLDNKMIYVYDL